MFDYFFSQNLNTNFFDGYKFFTPQYFTMQSMFMPQASIFSQLNYNSFNCTDWNNFNIPSFNFNNNLFNYNNFSVPQTTSSSSKETSPSSAKTTLSSSSSRETTPTRQSANTQSHNIGKFDPDYWKNRGYDAEKGKSLAIDAAKVKRGTPGECVGYTRKTINRVYGTSFTNAGKAVNFGSTILSQPELKNKFRKATADEIKQGGIPDGAVVLWKGGSPGFTKGKSATCGHGGIAYNGSVYSNYVESRHLSTYHEIWIPIKA